ncbi:MAG: hypothetical protein U0169_15330 [Polyangiaceae bacterium]
MAKRSPAFDGETRIETRNTTYYFVDGVCCEVKRHDGKIPTSEFIGMRVVGWLVHGGAEAVLEPEFRTGAYAVLYREPSPRENKPGNFALTSPAMAFVPACDSSARHRMASRPSLGAFGWAPAERAAGPMHSMAFSTMDDVVEAAGAVVTEAPREIPMLPPPASIPPSYAKPPSVAPTSVRPASVRPPSIVPTASAQGPASVPPSLPRSSSLPPRPVAIPRARASVPPPIPSAPASAQAPAPPRSGVALTARGEADRAKAKANVG